MKSRLQGAVSDCFRCAIPLTAAIAIWTGAPSITQAASIDTFTDRAAWEAAVGNNFVTEDFNALSNRPLSVGLNNLGLIDMRINGDVGFSSLSTYFQGDSRSQPGWSQDLVFREPIIGFGGHWNGTTTNALLVAIVSGQTIKFSDHLAYPGSGFLGVVSDTPFTEARISDEGVYPNETYTLDNLSFATAMPIPPSLYLFGTGLLVLAEMARRKADKARRSC
jgi:hypothetical protein